MNTLCSRSSWLPPSHSSKFLAFSCLPGFLIKFCLWMASSEEKTVQVVGPTDGWILERLARKLASKLPYAEFVAWTPKPGPKTRLVYYINYALYKSPCGVMDVGFFTHRDDEQQFLERARAMDFCVCMSNLYALWLRSACVKNVAHIPMGFDYYRYRPKLVMAARGAGSLGRPELLFAAGVRTLMLGQTRMSRLPLSQLP
jgi:hypothetical protein